MRNDRMRFAGNQVLILIKPLGSFEDGLHAEGLWALNVAHGMVTHMGDFTHGTIGLA